MAGLPPLVATVGVFADPDVDEFSDVEETCPTIYTRSSTGREDPRSVQSCGPDVPRRPVRRGDDRRRAGEVG